MTAEKTPKHPHEFMNEVETKFAEFDAVMGADENAGKLSQALAQVGVLTTFVEELALQNVFMYDRVRELEARLRA